jgi:hypothetical protein
MSNSTDRAAGLPLLTEWKDNIGNDPVIQAPPPAIEKLSDPVYRDRAHEVWLAASRVRIIVARWQAWWQTLADTGDADPGLAYRYSREAHRSLRVVFDQRPKMEFFEKETYVNVAGWLPPVPDSSLGHPRLPPLFVGDEWLEAEAPWQERHAPLVRKWGPAGTARNIHILEGALHALLALLKSYPATALDSVTTSPMVRRRIPPEKRTRPLGMQEAAQLMGYTRLPNEGRRPIKKAVAMLRAAMNDCCVDYEKRTRKQYIFNRDDFPKEAQDRIRPV